MKKTLLLSALALAAMAPAQAKKVESLPEGKYPVPIERRVPWTIISGSEARNNDGVLLEGNPLGGQTGDIDAVIDRNPLTYWHTGYNGNNVCNGQNDSHSHWFMIDRGAGADKVPFSLLSIQQRIIQPIYQQKWNGAVTDADVYVTDEFIGLQGGPTNQNDDDALIYIFTQTHEAAAHINPDVETQEAQLFEFDEPQTGRFVLVVINHTVSPGNEASNERYACLSEFNLFTGLEDTQMVSESNFPGYYNIDNKETNTVSDTKRTEMLYFSDTFRSADRISPLLQSKTGQEPFITYLNWLDWQSTCFDITPLMSVSAGAGHQLQIYADGAGSGLYKALYIDWDEDGFTAEDQVAKTDETVNLSTAKEGAGEDENIRTGHDPFTAQMPDGADKYGKSYRARYIVDTQNTSPNPSTGIGAAGGIVVDFTLKIEQPVTFNVNFTYDGQIIASHTNIEGFANEPYVLPSPDFFDIDVVAVAPDPDDFPDTDTPTVEISLQRLILPFVFTTLSEGQTVESEWNNLKWQAVQQHFNQQAAHHSWSYNGDDNVSIVEDQAANTSQVGYPDKQLWAFVGDIKNGFKVYNKAAGKDKWLYSDGTNAKVGTGAETLWKPFLSAIGNASPNKFCAFKANGVGNYINQQSAQLKFWSSADAGSTCWFIAAAAPMISFADVATSDPDNCVGGYSATYETLAEAAEAARINPTDAALAETLRSEIAKYIQSDRVPFDTNVWYRFENFSYRGEYFITSSNTLSTYGGEKNAAANPHSIFKFEPVPDAENRYYIISQGLYLGHPLQSQNVPQVDENGARGEYEIVEMSSPAVFAFRDRASTADGNNRSSLHHANHGGNNDIVGWAYDANASNWFMVLALDFDVTLNENIDGLGHVGFGYFPFPVTVGNDGSELFYLYSEKDKEDPTKHVVTYSKTYSVPAHTGFMIINPEHATANLKIDYNGIMTLAEVDDDTPVNVLEGTLRSTNAGENDYVIGTTDDGLGFVKTGDKAIAGNYVYIPEDKLPEEAKASGALPIYTPAQTTTTGIAELNGEKNAGRVIYDLQGRKLAAPAKGINIINGKKVLVK